MSKRTRTYSCIILGNLISAALSTACSSDDAEPAIAVDTPLEFIADGLGIDVKRTSDSRADAAINPWESLRNDSVAIQYDGKIWKYDIEPDEGQYTTTARLTSEDPIMIKTSTGRPEIIGRVPYTDSLSGDTLIWSCNNPSDNQNDLLLAYSDDIIKAGLRLNFYHTQVKIVINIRDTPFLRTLTSGWDVYLPNTDMTAEYDVSRTGNRISLSRIKSYNPATVSARRNNVANRVEWDTGTEQAAFSYETIIVAQQKATDPTFINIRVGSQLSYNLSLSDFTSGSSFEFKSGNVYTFNITVNGKAKDDVRITSDIIPWRNNDTNYSLTI